MGRCSTTRSNRLAVAAAQAADPLTPPPMSTRSVRASSPVAAVRRSHRLSRENPAAPLAPAGRRTPSGRSLRGGADA
jgi:hypothetical protein